MGPPERTTLLITPSVAGRALPDGRWELSRKFVAGAAAFAERWPGRVRVLMRARDEDDGNLDNEPYAPGDFPFDLECSPYAPDRLLRDDARSSLVLGAIDHPQLGMLRRAAAVGVRVVAITETTLRTRIQIEWSESPNPLRAARRVLRHWNFERHSRALLRLCRGIQCNGMPTFERYRRVCPRTMLFYDNRMDAASIPGQDRLERRLAALRQGGPLRLAFSGRLARLKGVHYLPDLVQRLLRAGVACRLDVFGDGPLRALLAGEIERLGLANAMTLHGAVPFQERLVPYLTDHVDLFVCCHEQGDPACTYMETLGCAVPILGFANEAWRGMQRNLRVGWTVPAGDVGAMATVASRLAADRAQLAAGAHAAREAATGHAFQETMSRRVAHLLECMAGAAKPAATSSDAASDRAARRRGGFIQGKSWLRRLLMPMIPAGWVKCFTPGLLFIAEKPGN